MRGEIVAGTEHSLDRLADEIGFAKRRQSDPEHARAEALDDPGCRLDRKPRLPGAAGP